MKKIILFGLCIFAVIGCSSKGENVETLNVKEYLHQDTDRFEILDVDDEYMYLNTYEQKYGLLYDSKSILVLNHDGELVKSYNMDKEERVLDFIIFNDIAYYMTLVKVDNEYVIELNKIMNDNTVSLNKWILKDPYNYPTFHLTNERVFYRVDDFLYSLDSITPVMDDEVHWLFGLEEPHKKSIGYKVLNEEGMYDVYESSNEEEPIFSHQYIGEFYIDDNHIIFNSRNSFKLYSYDMTTQKIECICDEETDSFKVGHNYIGVSTEKEIIIYDKQTYKVVSTIDKNKYNIDPIEYIYVIVDDFYIVSKDNNVVRIKVK